MKWVKLTKHYQGGERTDYMYVEDEQVKTHASQQELMESWGENSDGGHNYGYRVDMEILRGRKIPPKEWLERAIQKSKNNLGYLHSAIERTEELIKTYENLIK
jgi:hypothetical protein